jgi:mono/diheme cytochrome c family protein
VVLGWTLAHTLAFTLTLALALALAFPGGPLLAQSTEEIFTTVCATCHTTTSDRLIGPGLQGLEDRRDREWLLSFIMEPDRMIADGDSIATRLLAEYAIPMPNIGTTRAQAVALLDYIATAPATVTTAIAAQPEVSGPASEDQVLLGQGLFQGTTRLANGGPTCNSCHDVTNDAVIGGGILATELTTVFSRLGGPGVRAILGSPPFPVMQQAYVDKSLTEAEVAGLVAFLQQADAEQALHQPRDYGIRLFASGLGGALVLLGLYSMAWGGRRRGSVNQEIFDRQVKSV